MNIEKCKSCEKEWADCINACCHHAHNHMYSDTLCECGTIFCFACRLGGTNPSEPYRDYMDDHSLCPGCGKKHYWWA